MPQPVGTFRDPKTGATVVVYPKKRENKEQAMLRVQRKHGVSKKKTL